MSSSRRHGEREKDRRHHRGGRDDDSVSPPPAKKKSGKAGMNEYWVDGEGINREVMQMQICLMLGNSAYSRPDVYNGISGYRVTAIRPFTDEQLEDLIKISQEYEQERDETRQRKSKNEMRAFTYDQSKTARRNQHPDMDSPYREDSYGYDGRGGAPEGYPGGMSNHPGGYGPGSQGGYLSQNRRPSPPRQGAAGYLGGSGTGYPSRGYPEDLNRIGGDGPPYYGGGGMDIDPIANDPYRGSGRGDLGANPYGMPGPNPALYNPGGPNPGIYNPGGPQLAGHPGGPYMSNQMDPRYIPTGNPPGMRDARMPADYNPDPYGGRNFDAGGAAGGRRRHDGPPHYDDYGRRPQR